MRFRFLGCYTRWVLFDRLSFWAHVVNMHAIGMVPTGPTWVHSYFPSSCDEDIRVLIFVLLLALIGCKVEGRIGSTGLSFRVWQVSHTLCTCTRPFNRHVWCCLCRMHFLHTCVPLRIDILDWCMDETKFHSADSSACAQCEIGSWVVTHAEHLGYQSHLCESLDGQTRHA